MNTDFKVGDYILCVNDENPNQSVFPYINRMVKKGEIYRIRSFAAGGCPRVEGIRNRVNPNFNEEAGYLPHRFVKVTKPELSEKRVKTLTRQYEVTPRETFF